jgi:hypothetical protein
MYDLIGDIHGHADELVQLLETLGYEKAQGLYRHPDRRVIFLGDFIDRGPKIQQALEIVRPMIEEGVALAVMGNHELNALTYHTEDPETPGEYLRRHTPKNEKQHRQTLEQLSSQELQSYLEWFRTLPMWLDLDGLRAVHACWDEQSMMTIAQAHKDHGGVSATFLQSACLEEKPLIVSVEVVLKGKEGKLPDGASFQDKDGHVRTEIRTRWYLAPNGHTYRTYAFQSDEIACDLGLDEAVIAAATPYPATAKPVFVGHYWLSAERPKTLADNVACLDFSVAMGGFLCAYRWNGEQKLSNENFVWVKADRMDKDTMSLKERLARLDREYPLVPHTNAGRLSSTVRRMKAEKEMDIPINLRSCFAVSAKTGKAANKMTEQEWEDFYHNMCEQLRRDYPEKYASVFHEKR